MLAIVLRGSAFALRSAAGDRRAALDQYRRYLQHNSTGPLAERIRHWVEVIQRFYNGSKSQSQDDRIPGRDLADEPAPLSSDESKRLLGRRPAKAVPRGARTEGSR